MQSLRRRTGATTRRPCRCASASGRRARVPSWPSAPTASSGRRHVRPAGFPSVGPADQSPEGLALAAPVLGRRFHGVEGLRRLVPVPAAEVLALLENNHTAL